MSLAAKDTWCAELQPLPLQTICTARGAVACREAGTGPPMVFLHGISSGSGSWVHQLIHFRERHRCVAWDAPGYGGSAAITAASPVAAEYASRLEALLDALEIERVLLVGHSLGAIMATAFAAERPKRVDGMVLLNPATGYGAAPREEADRILQARLDQIERLGVEGFAENRAGALVSGSAPPEAVDLIRWNMRRLSSAGYTQAAQMLASANLLEDAPSFPGPTLVACGARDTITPEAKCRQVADAFPRGRYTSLPRLGHISYIEDPPAVNRILTEFQAGLNYG